MTYRFTRAFSSPREGVRTARDIAAHSRWSGWGVQIMRTLGCHSQPV